MIWSNWQGALWRGAGVVLLFWAGLAWTQSPARPAGNPAERIMVVHENGRSTRCRVLESWQLPDGRIANLLEALETGERITIVDEQPPGLLRGGNKRVMPKRIFTWGRGRSSPPEGSPIPPQLRHDSGIVIKNETPPPSGAVVKEGPVIVNRIVDEKPLGKEFMAHTDGPVTILKEEPAMKSARPGLFQRLFQRPEKQAQPQVVDFKKAPAPAPLVINEQPKPSIPLTVKPKSGSTPIPTIVDPPSVLPGTGQPVPLPAIPEVANPVAPTPILPLNRPTLKPEPPAVVTPPSVTPPSVTPPSVTPPSVTPPSVVSPSPGIPAFEPSRPDPVKPAEPQTKKPWRLGSNLQAWLRGRGESKPDAAKPGPVKSEGTKKLATEEYLAQQNKVAEKQLTQKIEKISRAPFSTAMVAQPNQKKPEPTPLAILAPAPSPEKPLVDPKPAPIQEPQRDVKRDMWGTPASPIQPPGRTLVGSGTFKPDLVKLPPPPVARVNDPLTSPERLIPPDNPKLTPKGAMLPAVSRPDRFPAASRPDSIARPAEPQSNPNVPLGAQSVLAAKNGILGPVTYLPVPTVTVPYPHNPPMPPAPKLPDPPQLNANVNAFSQPPAPRAPQQQNPMHQNAFSSPMQNQQQILAQQQQMLAQQQQMLAQQAMMQYGYYRQNPYMMNPYMPQQGMMNPMLAQGSPYGQPPMAPSSGPMNNFSRYYNGPAAPSPYAVNRPMAMPYGQTGYPHQAPMYATVPQMQQPQQQVMQPASHQQMPTQQQATTQQVQQLIKVLRESPYPAQREWAAQSLTTNYEWRAHPQIVPAILQAASQDPASSVRAGSVYCLGRMGAAVEPVFGALHSLRNDIDPRVRQEVEQAFTRLGQTPMAPQ
ncbi:MAG: HEAT repeat domain-containing protein [Planctomycetes bacterium]|nr:HEAT repeat domain-containing protein [Planctomycetota bacterium]